MFIAALLNAWPELGPGLVAAVRAAGVPEAVAVTISEHADHALTGTRFVVDESSAGAKEANAHSHRHFSEIRGSLCHSLLDAGVKARAIEIFTVLADAEGHVHGVPPEDVSFHEVGALDSIADVVGAAYLLDALGIATWSCEPLPMGSGKVQSAHGELPLPAPAVTRLLEGFPLFNDGRSGERVTPTGAAILRHLAPSFEPQRAPMTLARSGTGFGTRRFDGISNVLRILAFEEPHAAAHGEPAVLQGTVAVLIFEVDDQTPEDLALGLERLRAEPHVLDVTQDPVFGKKGRLVTRVQVLAEAENAQRVAARCLCETSTLGVRWSVVQRMMLSRRTDGVVDESGAVRVKSAIRPDGTVTAKAESDDVARAGGGFARRQRLRRRSEAAVLEKEGRDQD